MTTEILGIPLAKNIPETVSPYSVLAVVKGFDTDGDEVYVVAMTDGMTPVEGASLVHLAELYINEQIRDSFVTSRPS